MNRIDGPAFNWKHVQSALDRFEIDPELLIRMWTACTCCVVNFGHEYELLLATAKLPTLLPRFAETDAGTVPYVSGTTGMPKAVILSHCPECSSV